MRRPKLLALFWVLVVTLYAANAGAAPHGPFNHSDENWRVVETRYFRIYASDKNAHTVRHLIRIADATFERLNQFYHVSPPHKIAVSVVGYTDFSNAFADSFRNRITIYATPANFHNRSRVPWLDNVFTHELSHILSLNAASHWSRRIPVVIGTGLLRGESSQGLVRLPVYPHNLPHWFVEGVAQFDTHLLGRDAFDENRAGYQRAAWEDDLFFPLGKLAFFGHEKWYNTGFSFLLYLEERFGRGTVHRLFLVAGERHNLEFSGLFQDVLGVPLPELEADFRRRVERAFLEHRRKVHGGKFDGTPVALEDQEVAYAELDGKERDALRGDYRSRPMRYVQGRLYYTRNANIAHARFDAKTGQLSDEQVLAKGSQFAPNADRGHFVLRQEGHTPSLLPNVYRPEFESSTLFWVLPGGEQRALLTDSRLMDFDVCTSRSELAGVYNDGDGSLSLVLYPMQGAGTDAPRLRSEQPRFILPAQALDDVRSPRYSPDCKRLYFSRRAGDDHDIYYYDFEKQSVIAFAAEDAFELYPEPVEDGVYFVSARDGTMSVYFRRYADDAVERLTEAVTAHHYPVATPDALVFSRLTGTGFHAYHQPITQRAPAPRIQLQPKADVAHWDPVETWDFPSGPYQALASRNTASPLIVPIVDFYYQPSEGVSAQVGVDLLVEDYLRTHSLRFNGFVGARSSFWLGYENSMTPLTIRATGGMTTTRNEYVFDRADGQSFAHIQSSAWGFLSGSVGAPLNLFYSAALEGETIRDTGSTLGARRWPFDFKHPRFGRDRVAAVISYDGLDRSDPVFRERVVNKRGYRSFEARGAYAVEEVHALLREFDASLPSGRKPYGLFELDYHEYIALPELGRGFFDHSLQIDVSLGYITRDIYFLPFFGGGRLRSLTIPELSTSVGFAGYGPYSLVGETLANAGLSYRFPLARDLGWDYRLLYLEDIYAQLFTSWGNIWGFDANGRRQRPWVDRAGNGQRLVGDVGVDLRFNHFLQEIEANVGTTLRTAYRLVPFTECVGSDSDPECLGVNGRRGFMFYLMLGVGF